MKKMLSMLLALTVAAVGVFSAFPVTCSADDCGTTVSATIEDSSNHPIKVDITWDSMEYTYTDGGWNGTTHSYDGGGWTTEGGVITVANKGLVSIYSDFSYIPFDAYSNIGGSFSKTYLGLDVNEQGDTTLSLFGEPDQALQKEPIGVVLVTITVAEVVYP